MSSDIKTGDFVQIADLLARPITCFANIKATKPEGSVTVSRVLQEFRGDVMRNRIAAVRRDADGSALAGDAAKKALPLVAFSGVFLKAGNDGLKSHSGLLCLDFDHLEDVATARSILKADDHTVAAWLSPRGQGIKALVAIHANADLHGRCFREAADHFRRLGLVADEQCKDVGRRTYWSWDDKLWVAESDRRAFGAGGGIPAPIVLSAPICTTAPTAPSTLSAQSALSAQQGEGVAGARRRRKAIEAEMATRPRLARIYSKFVEQRPAKAGERNATITKMVPAVFEVVSEKNVLWMSLAWFETNRAIFKDPREQHEKETAALITGRAVSYRGELSAPSAAVYDELDERERAAFRICRDLARRGKGDRFFLSCDELGERISHPSMTAYRILRGFAGDGIIALSEPGVRRAPGVAPRATEYLWLLK